MAENDLVQISFTEQVGDDTGTLTSNGEIEPGDGASDRGGQRTNELDGKTWTRYSISIWSDIRKTQEEIALGHPAIFPVALVGRLIEVFTNRNDRIVLDPFAGIGSTVVAAQTLGKEGVGIELSPEFAEKARMRCQQKTLLDIGKGSGTIHTADARDLLQYVAAGSVDLVVTSPPYWDILTEKRTADYKEIRNYGDIEADLGRINDYREFLAQLKAIFVQLYKAMRQGAYCCVIVMDIRKKNRFYPFHSDIADFMQEIGFIYDDIIIWDRRHEYNNMRPLGYPRVFRVNKAHEFILIFQKPKTPR
ncbi:MAG: site-specific DNA-methyltransferase [Anaerolineae bacterium]|nr:site-specific DNA-methyltransferase [Anaerolineae bacterium]